MKKVEYAGTVLRVGTWHPATPTHYHTSPTLRMRPDFGCETDDVMLWAMSVTSFLAVLYVTTVAQVAICMYLREHLVCGDVTCDNSPLPKLV